MNWGKNFPPPPPHLELPSQNQPPEAESPGHGCQLLTHADKLWSLHQRQRMGHFLELESIMLSEISQAVKDKYHMISPLTGT